MNYAFIFPGQGSQSVGMGKDVYDSFDVSRQLLHEASKELDIDFFDLMFKENELLNISQYTQPAIVLNSLMFFRAFKKHINLQPKFLLGHSLGEFSSVVAGGGLSEIDAINIVNKRGIFMQEACKDKDVAMMVVMGLDDKSVESICEFYTKDKNFEVFAANYNCDSQIVVAGIKSHLENLQDIFKQKGAKRTIMLNMSVISHCPMLKSACLKLYDILKDKLCSLGIPVISNATSKAYKQKNDALNALKDQLIMPVLYKQSIKSIENEVDCFIEFGSSVLQGINKKITSKPTYSIKDVASLEKTLNDVRTI